MRDEVEYGRDVLIGVESEPVKRGNGMDSGTGSVLISSRRETRWLGETCLGFSGSLSDCSGSVARGLVSYRSGKSHETSEIYKMYEL